MEITTSQVYFACTRECQGRVGPKTCRIFIGFKRVRLGLVLMVSLLISPCDAFNQGRYFLNFCLAVMGHLIVDEGVLDS